MKTLHHARRLNISSRRDFLRKVGTATGMALLSGTAAEYLTGCLAGPDADTCYKLGTPNIPLTNTDWLHTARIAGLATYGGEKVCEFSPALDRMADEHVSVVEVDSELSSYLTEDAFGQQLAVLDLVARECHKRGMRCVAYYPILESLTPNAEQTDRTMSKEHSDWVQLSMNGKPNVFIGGAGRVFWVEPGTESAWLCPTSGYVDYFIERVKKLVGTSLDGLWGDVPLLSDIAGVWPCVNSTCNAKFLADTGLHAPTQPDWNNPAFVKWVAWRHRLIFELEQRIVESAKRVRSDFEVIIETVTMDYGGATTQGLDGAWRDDGNIYRVWEVDAVSDSSAMRLATYDDWISMAIMMKHARGCAAPRPTWCFCYGLEPDDAEHVMSLCIASGCNPYETKIPQINTSVGSDYRKRMYTWLEQHPGLLLSEPANQTALMYSSASRDIVDRARGIGLYASINQGVSLWWADADIDSVKAMDYLADYRGVSKIFFSEHIPFNVLTTPHVTSAKLSGYSLVAVPSPAGLADAVIGALRDYVVAGGSLVVTGPDPGIADENGMARATPALLAALQITTPQPGWMEKTLGAGRVLYNAERVGKTYFTNVDPMIASAIAKLAGGQIETDAPPSVLFDLRKAKTGELLLVCANLSGLGSKGLGYWTPSEAHFNCGVAIGSARVVRVTVTKPDAGARDTEVPFTVVSGKVRFAVSMNAAAAAIIVLG